MIDALDPGSGERSDAFVEFYESAYERVARLGFLLTGNAAVGEELAQDVFAQLYRRWDDVREPAAWVRTAMVSRSNSWWRQVKRRTPPDPTPGTADPADALTVRTVLAGLPMRYRTALVLRYFDDLPERDIALAMGCAEGTVRSLVHRGLRRMREELR